VAHSGRLTLVGQILAHYRINAAIGAGGMGEVYRATDAKLGREVALKVLPQDVASDPERLARFEREARAVAALNHPNVVTLYSVEEEEGVHFLTMELIEGQSLDRLISTNGLPVDRIVDIAQALAEALAAAHEKGIVHRDLKPANVMVTNGGRVKVLDFGLAKDVGAGSSDDATLPSGGRTQAGMVMGTPAYMSPEQVSGRPLDHRTDIFSLGVLLHEMATGRRPFNGTSSAELVSSILRDNPPLVTDVRSDLPSDLARVIRRCLEKDPRYRVQTARDVSNEFRDLARLGSLPAPASTPASPAPAIPDSGALRADEGFWVAVLPFKYAGGNADLTTLADGLTDDILTGFARFSYLRVIARSSTSRYANQAVDVRAVARELGARYVMEGSIRQAGTKVRIVVQLVDASSGVSLWAETYDRAYLPEAMLDLLDDVVPRIVATVGDTQGVLAHSMTEALRQRDPESLTPYEALLRSFGFHQHVSAVEVLAGITALERAVKQAPDRADCWAMLSWLYRAEYTHDYNPRPDSMERSLAAARRAVTLAPSSQLANAALASAFFFRGELGSFRVAAERALALNSMEGYITAFLGMHFAYAGDWERGCTLAERATRLNPNHPGWYYSAMVVNAYRQHDSERALELALRINMPDLWTAQLMLTVIYSQLGDTKQASAALRHLLTLRSDFASAAPKELRKWWQPDMVEQMLGDLREAGLNTPEAAAAPGLSSGAVPMRTAQKPAPSGPASAAQSIAVLPFANLSDDKEQEYFSDGLAEEIINLLAQVSGLKVIARTSAFAFRGKKQDIRGIAEALGVSTILEGSVRRSGNRIRVTAQLIAAADGSHLWSERYDRELSDIFAVQDEISEAIARALRVKLSREAVPQRYTPRLPAYEAYLKGKYLQAKVTPESLELARRCYEQASELDPAFAMAHVGLGYYWVSLAHFGRHPAHECVPAARAAVQRALQIDTSLPDAHALLGYLAAMYDLDWAAAEKHFDFPMAKQAGTELIRPMYSGFLFLRGNPEQAIQLAQAAIEDDPLEVWARMNLHAYLQAVGRDAEALEQLKRVLELDQNQVVALVSMAMIRADKGDFAEALMNARRAYAIGPWFPDTTGVLAALMRRNGDEVEAKSVAKALGSGEAPGDARAHALFHLLCGEIDRGADWAEKAIEQRDPSMMFYLRFVVCKELRASHRWPKIAKMINLPVEAQAQASAELS